MKSQHLLKRLVLAAFLVGTTSSIGGTVFAQSFYYYPSASFFSPTAYFYETGEEEAYLTAILKGEQFATFNRNLQETKLATTIDQKEVFTVLAPTEEAFAALSPKLKEKLSEPETLRQVMQYHLVVGNIGEKDIKRRGVATLLEQNSVNITGVQDKNKKVTVMLNDATASEPLPASNGVVIPIDRVLIPPDLNL
jgi:uncharacterized surface protein with fasciclin (FAS1) repeats